MGVRFDSPTTGNTRMSRAATYSEAELAAMMVDVESDLVERKESFGGDAPTAIRQAICAFANDLPGHNRPGVIFVGVRDDGSPAGSEINDALLQRLAQCRSDGNILPPPSMTVAKHTLGGKEVAVVTVAPADSPPVRFRGRIWIRVGPSRALATAQDERVLNEKRRYGDAPFDARPVRNATLADLDLPRFQYLYLPNAFDADVLAANDRTVEERLAATKMIAAADDPVPTVLGILMLSHKPTDFLPGAYVQFLRFGGRDRHDPVEDSSRFDAAVAETMRDLDSTLRAHIHTAVEVGTGSTEIRRATYPLAALQELVRNAVMHRTYEGTNSPIHVSWFTDRVEIISPGGAYGDVSAMNFGEPGVVDYRNPNLADAMRVTGLVQRYGIGIPLARRALRANNQAEPMFEVDAHRIRCTVTIRPDWRAGSAA